MDVHPTHIPPGPPCLQVTVHVTARPVGEACSPYFSTRSGGSGKGRGAAEGGSPLTLQLGQGLLPPGGALGTRTGLRMTYQTRHMGTQCRTRL